MTEDPRSLLDELKERKLIQWALGYLGGAFVALQVMDALEGPLGLSQRVELGILVLIVVGFPISLVVAWYHGRRGHQRVTGTELAIVAGLLGLGGLGAILLAARVPGPLPGPSSTASSSEHAGGAPSIAILPFDDLSPEGDQEYFASGMAEELMNVLATQPNLTVVARTSAAAAKREGLSIREIGDRLGVQNVMEGSLRKDDQRIRITTRLVRVEDEANLWSTTYDRDLEDVFAIQSDVAQQIARALEATLSPSVQDRIAAGPTADTAAYELYLRGRFFWNRRTEQDQRLALGFFEQAIARDSTFAEAWAGLGDTYLMLPFYSAAPEREMVPRAREAAEHALELNQDLAEAHTTLAYAEALFEWDFEAADQGFRRALELQPNYANALKWHSDVLAFMERYDEALTTAQRARVLDPLSPNIVTIEGLMLWFLGRDDEALSRWDEALELDPGFPLTLSHASRVHWSRGDTARFFAALEGLEEAGVPLAATASEVRSAYQAGGREAALELQVSAPAARGLPMDRARWHVELGDLDAAFEALDQAFEERTVWLPFVVAFPDLAPLREDQRYGALLRRMGIR